MARRIRVQRRVSLTDMVGDNTNPIAVTSVLNTMLVEDPASGQWYHPLKIG